MIDCRSPYPEIYYGAPAATEKRRSHAPASRSAGNPFGRVVCRACNAARAAADVTVFAAASLKEALDDQAKQFEATTGNKVIVSYAGSNTLAKQIESGAPADVFISADLDWMDYLDQRTSSRRIRDTTCCATRLS